VLARPEAPVPVETLAPPAEVTAHVPDATGYQHLYTIDIPRQPKFADAAVRPSYYSVNNASRLRTRPTRVSPISWSCQEQRHQLLLDGLRRHRHGREPARGAGQR
jgi:hypothetical protein